MVVFSIDGKVLVSGGCDRNIKIWEIESGEILKILEGYFSDIC